MNSLQSVGKTALTYAQDIGLLLIGVATLIAIGSEVTLMIENRAVTLADLLLLFIYMEVLAMVSIYLESGKMPIRIPLYIAIVALARYMILDMKNMDTWQMIAVASAGLLIALTILVIRFGHVKYPYDQDTQS